MQTSTPGGQAAGLGSVRQHHNCGRTCCNRHLSYPTYPSLPAYPPTAALNSNRQSQHLQLQQKHMPTDALYLTRASLSYAAELHSVDMRPPFWLPPPPPLPTTTPATPHLPSTATTMEFPLPPHRHYPAKHYSLTHIHIYTHTYTQHNARGQDS